MTALRFVLTLAGVVSAILAVVFVVARSSLVSDPIPGLLILIWQIGWVVLAMLVGVAIVLGIARFVGRQRQA